MASVTNSADLSDISMGHCSSHCNPDRCVISGINVCSHPNKGGMQRPGQQPPDVLKRYAEACQILGVKNKFEVTP